MITTIPDVCKAGWPVLFRGAVTGTQPRGRNPLCRPLVRPAGRTGWKVERNGVIVTRVGGVSTVVLGLARGAAGIAFLEAIRMLSVGPAGG